MTLKDLKDVTNCNIFVGYTDGDGAEHFAEYKGKAPDRQVGEIWIQAVPGHGIVLAVELQEEGA